MLTAPFILIIFNPASGVGNRAKVDAVIQVLEAAGATVELYLTQCAGDASRFLSEYRGVFDIVAAAGGDGTVNEVVNGLKDRPVGSYRLAIIPTGTTNVLASELRFPKKPKALADVILGNQQKDIFLGQVNQRRFVLMVGVGFDAWVVDKVNLNLKKKVGKLAYVLSMLKEIRNFGSKTYRLTIDGEEHLANSVVITNGRYYGGSFTLSRQADLSRDTTQVMMISGSSPWKFVGILLGLPLGIMEKMPGMRSMPAKHMLIEQVEENSQREPVQADGDSVSQLPLELSMEPESVPLLVP